MNRLPLIFLMLHAVYAVKKTIPCQFENSVFIGNTFYTCNVYSDPQVTEPFDEDVEFTGTHVPGKTNDDVQAFYARGEGGLFQLHYFPRGLSATFKNLRSLTVANAGLKEVHKEDLESLGELEQVNFIQNKIEVLEEDLFKGNPKIKELNIESNLIKYIHPTALNNLDNLDELELKENECINEGYYTNPAFARYLAERASIMCDGDVDVYNAYLKQKEGRKAEK